MNALELIGRSRLLFREDLAKHEAQLKEQVSASRFLIIGGAGSIGQAVTREILKRKPRAIHIVDISENNMVELVRDIRSTIGYNNSDFQTFAIDCGGREFDALLKSGSGYDYVLNLSALKHVRSEKDPFTLMRMVQVNILNTVATLQASQQAGANKYFCVSTDKAANPVNMMGASKKIMEMFLMRASQTLPISTARFANVAFSDGSLLHGFNQRFAKNQPITAPNDVRRYFLTPQESGELCLMSCLMGNNREIFFPKLSETLKFTKFSDIAVRYLRSRGYEPKECETEDEARDNAASLIARGKWPIYFFESNTTGEKDFEEFFTKTEQLDLKSFISIGVIPNNPTFDGVQLDQFLDDIQRIRARETWEKIEIVELFKRLIPEFNHLETNKYLDNRM